MLYDETHTMCCSLFLAYTAPYENIVSIYFLCSSFFLSGVCNAQYGVLRWVMNSAISGSLFVRPQIFQVPIFSLFFNCCPFTSLCRFPLWSVLCSLFLLFFNRCPYTSPCHFPLWSVLCSLFSLFFTCCSFTSPCRFPLWSVHLCLLVLSWANVYPLPAC